MKTLKLLLLGISMFFTGIISFAILVGAAVISTFTIDSSNCFMDTWKLHGVLPIAIAFFLLGFIGLIIAFIGFLQKVK
ncbi:hypothetical protein [uncultured Anaerococcus sp.]|uniref:hypothetical protein n=1 Tax=uncultured Anaerococcus sp. TaxID=293428 RepID=UPI0025D7B6A5|nr:hypothetical protein [uncultured Anaerococcus sp.]